MSKNFNWGKTSLKRMEGIDERLVRVLFRAIQIFRHRVFFKVIRKR